MTQTRIANKLFKSRAIFVGGAALPDSVAEQARTLKLPVILSYGMTETAAMVAVLSPDEFHAGFATCGRPLSHVKIDVISANDRVCTIGHTGRIRIRGRSVCKGYRGGSGRVGRREFLTDDEGYFDSLGRLHVLGRVDRLITSGEKVDPREVERVIRDTGAVDDVLVLGWPDPEWGQKLVAFYVTKGVRSDELMWEREIRSDLVNYKIPKVMVRVEALPFDSRGKLDRGMIGELLKEPAQKSLR